MAKVIDFRSAKPDDPVYFRGLRVRGRQSKSSKQNTPKWDNVVSSNVMSLGRAVKLVSAEMNAAIERQVGITPEQ